jgi:hypothetical protein
VADSGDRVTDPHWKVDFLGMNTTFQVNAILKGKLEGDKIKVLHYRLKGGMRIRSGPLLVTFRTLSIYHKLPEGGKVWLAVQECMLFLKKCKDGRYEPVSGRIDPLLSIRELSHPLPESASDTKRRWADDDENGLLEWLPQPMTKAVKLKFPTAQVISAENGGGKWTRFYELEMKEGERKWEAAFTHEGKFLASREYVQQSDLPANVTRALRKDYPDAKVLEVEKRTAGEGAATEVVFTIVIEKHKRDEDGPFVPRGNLEVQFTPDGKSVP